MPEYGFAGLSPGDRWCLCAARWVEAFDRRAPVGLDLEFKDGAPFPRVRRVLRPGRDSVRPGARQRFAASTFTHWG